MMIFFQSKSKIKIFFDIVIPIIFGLTFFSIPFCSFRNDLNIITWVLTILLLLCISLSLIFCHSLFFDFISLSFLLFIISAFISTLLNGMNNSSLTPILLVFLTMLVYMYVNANKKSAKWMFLSSYAGTCIFIIVFIFSYWNEILSLNIDRLGQLFGDVNDISLFFGYGLVFSLFLLLFKKGIFVKIISSILAILFVFCGLTTGSKIFIFIALIAVIMITFMKFGRKKLWLSFLIVGIIITAGIFLLSLPVFETIRNRFLALFSTLGISDASNTYDGSTVNRFVMFADGIEMFLRKPLFGFGINGFANYGGITNGWSHNHISEMLCNFGLSGFIFFHYGFFVSLISYFNTKKYERNILASAGLLLLTFFLVAMISVSLITEKIYAMLIGVIIASMTSTKQIKLSNILETIKRRKNK